MPYAARRAHTHTHRRHELMGLIGKDGGRATKIQREAGREGEIQKNKTIYSTQREQTKTILFREGEREIKTIYIYIYI